VEDFTERGIKDLERGLIRTPLEPLQTFLDDPLRVLRTIRFATRFQFEISPEIY
jgi:tRNA nucleotidyltransferase (CCA-adding enzyme)